jgi:phospholipid/cholesterol/gamma-HCH transport system substrate-binding protein
VSKEFKIGIITIVAGALLYYGFNFLRGSDIFSQSNRYYVIYPNVAGLNVSNPVLFNGLRIGRVSGFTLQQNANRIVVSVDIDQSFFIGKSDTASLANNDFFGTKAIVIYPGNNPEALKPGDTLRSNIDGDLLSQLEPVADNLTTTLADINLLLDQLNSTDIKGVVDTLKYSIGTITYKVNSLDVQQPVDSLTMLISNLNRRSQQLEGVINSSQALLDSVNNLPFGLALDNLNKTLELANSLLTSIQSEQGTVGKLMNDDSLYNNLNKVLLDLDELIIHFNNYPKDFLKPLGRKNKKLRGVSNAETGTNP